MSLGNSAVQVRKLLLRPTRLQHRQPWQILQVASLLDLADNPLSSAQCRQFISQPRKPTTQGSFIDEAQRGLGNKSGLGCTYTQATARTLDGLGIELALKNPPRYDDLRSIIEFCPPWWTMTRERGRSAAKFKRGAQCTLWPAAA